MLHVRTAVGAQERTAKVNVKVTLPGSTYTAGQPPLLASVECLPPGKLRQPPAEQPRTQRPSFTDTVQVWSLSDSRASAVRLQISSLVKWKMKSSYDILGNGMRGRENSAEVGQSGDC